MLFGGFHDDPASRSRFLVEAAKLPVAPRLVAIEWELAVFESFRAARPIVEDELGNRWAFLNSRDKRELSEALGWEGDVWRPLFPSAEVLWLEEGFQSIDLDRRFGTKAKGYPARCARTLLDSLLKPTARSAREFLSGKVPAEPRSLAELVSRLAKRLWDDRDPDDGDRLDRDVRWAERILAKVAGWEDGLVIVLVGWSHADPMGPDGRLSHLLKSAGLAVESIRLDPEGVTPG
jgi:hypothetical protein